MAESREGYETGDPFAEEISPEVRYVLDQYGLDEKAQTLTIDGRVTVFTVAWELKRQVAGEYTGDAVRGYARLEPNLPCPIVVNKPVALIQSSGDALPVVGEVFRRFGRMLDLQTYELIVEHNKTVIALRDGKPQPVQRVKMEGGATLQKPGDVL